LGWGGKISTSSSRRCGSAEHYSSRTADWCGSSQNRCQRPHTATARDLGLPDIVDSGTTKSQAIEQLRTALADLQLHCRLMHLDLPLPSTPVENPWLRFAGMWKHDPDWEAFQAAVDSYRLEIDAQYQPK
jgi:hypothetical protein